MDQQVFKIRIKLAKSLPGAKHLLNQTQNESLFLFDATAATQSVKTIMMFPKLHDSESKPELTMPNMHYRFAANWL